VRLGITFRTPAWSAEREVSWNMAYERVFGRAYDRLMKGVCGWIGNCGKPVCRASADRVDAC